MFNPRTNEEEAAAIDQALADLAERAVLLSGRERGAERHRWNRVNSNINSARVGCQEIMTAKAKAEEGRRKLADLVAANS